MEPSKIDVEHPLQRSFTQPMVEISLPQQRYLCIHNIFASLVRRIKALGDGKVKPLLIVAMTQKRRQHIVDGVRQAERVARVKGADGIADGLLCWPHALVGDVDIEERAGVCGRATLKGSRKAAEEVAVDGFRLELRLRLCLEFLKWDCG